MDEIIWGPSYSVGVGALDRQHERIVRTINLLCADHGASVRSETVSDVLNDLTSYANEHFLAEERLLEEHGYPELEDQKNEHRRYRLKVVEFCQSTMDRRDSVPEDLRVFVRNWWQDHILVSDMRYRSFLKDRGVK